jgi:hypothetical protein
MKVHAVHRRKKQISKQYLFTPEENIFGIKYIRGWLSENSNPIDIGGSSHVVQQPERGTYHSLPVL